jgi:hypothetical protein
MAAFFNTVINFLFPKMAIFSPAEDYLPLKVVSAP